MAHDRRFDGRFFIGVLTTRVYCRPICPVSPPRRRNVVFYPSAAAAEELGFRPCRRCRPEAAPGTPAWSGRSASVARALRLIAEGALDQDRVDDLAERLGVGARHLRRLFAEELGASPVAVAKTRRVHFARRLIDETSLPMSEIALSSGFRSIRHFNYCMRATFRSSPRELRRRAIRQRKRTESGELCLRLPYRPPYDWEGLLGFLAPRVIPGVECVADGRYRRVIDVDGGFGLLEAFLEPASCHLMLRLRVPETRGLMSIVQRARRLFDLDADPLRIQTDLRADRVLAERLSLHPGVRLPGAWDPFEVAVRAILGQQVTVKGATALAGRLVRTFGKPVEWPGATPLTHQFPTPEALAEANPVTLGLPRARANALRRLARAMADRELSLLPGSDPEEVVCKLRGVPGIGEWTAQYVAMRALGEPDAFPAGDLGLRKALSNEAGLISPRALQKRALRWRPWRAYAAMCLWRALASRASARPPPLSRRALAPAQS